MSSKISVPAALLIILSSFISIFPQLDGEEKELRCLPEASKKAKYKMLSFGRGKELQIDLLLNTKHRSDEALIDAAKELKAMYCRDPEIRITYFSSKEAWKTDPRETAATPLAIYYLNRATNEEGIHFYSVVNNKAETRVVNLSLKNDSFRDK